MEFECDRCQKRFSTSYQPVTGRMYRIPCKCGNTIVLRYDLPGHAKPPAFPPGAAPRRTPPPLPDRYLCMANVRARAESAMQTMTAGECAPAPDATSPVQTSPAQQTSPTNDRAARAQLDPTASPEVSGEYSYEPSTSVPFGLAFALSRRRAFLAGCGAGAGIAIVLLAAVTLVAWLSGPRSANRVVPAPTVTNASKTEQAPAPLAAPLAAANATVGGDRAAPDVPRRVKRAARVVAAPPLVEKVPAAHPTAVDREDAARADDDEGKDSPASDDEAESEQLAEAEDGQASDGAEAPAQTTEEHGPALDERAAAATDAATEAPKQADASSDGADRVALVPAVEPEQTSASDGAPGAPANEGGAK
jgi:hypothetical protein